jgi:hypothetical protein
MTRMSSRFVAMALTVLMAAGGTQALSADQALMRSAPGRAAQAASGLKIVVIAGENAVNIIQQKTAVGPIVEVRDRNDLPVAGAVVTFTIPNAQGAIFGGGLQQLTVTTNAVGRAQIAELTPVGRGPFEIQIRAAHQGQTATTSITQRNFTSFADAAAGGDTPPQQQTPQQAAPQAPAATTPAAPVSSGAAAGGGGGMGALTKTLIFGGLVGGGGFATYKVLTKNHPPTVSGITATPGTVLLGTNTAISFSAQTADEDDDALTFNWEFGDGSTSTQSAPSKVYTSSGSFTVRLTISDGKESASTTTSVTVATVTGTWRSGTVSSTAGNVTWTMSLSQNGSSISGTVLPTHNTNAQFWSTGTISGSVRSSTPNVVVTGRVVGWADPTFSVTPNAGITTLTGMWTDTGGGQSITFTKQ